VLFDREHNLVSEWPGEATKMSACTLAARYGLDQDHRVILYAGTFETYQGLDLLVDASPIVIQVCANVRFLCLGGNRNQVATIRARIHRQGVAQSFILPGTIPAEEVEQHFSIASILVSPRILGMNTPLKIYSYLRSGVPIVATSILSHTQVLTAQVALLVEPDPESLAAGILKLLDDNELSQRLAQNALHLARNSYSAEAYHRKIAEVFSFLAGKSQARP
jgi:glycosyltransferase involved in cell wall biosynthesis